MARQPSPFCLEDEKLVEEIAKNSGETADEVWARFRSGQLVRQDVVWSNDDDDIDGEFLSGGS